MSNKGILSSQNTIKRTILSESIIAETNNNKINYWGEKMHLKARSRGKDNESELGRSTKRFAEYVHGQDLLSLEEG